MQVQIVVPVRGAHEALRLCLACLYAHTNHAYVEVAIPHAQDEHSAVLNAWSEAINASGVADTRTDADATPEPQSFARNCNRGAKDSDADFLVFLNSDAFVGPGWLDALLAPFADPDVVAVGPMGTNVSGHQGVTDGKYLAFVEERAQRTPESIAMASGAFGMQARNDGRLSFYRARRLVGFCLAVRRSAWNEVGGFDERFENGFCDDDLSLRLSLVGDCVVVPDLLVLHAGSASFAELPDAGPNYCRTLVENEVRFNEKWARRGLLQFLGAWFDSRGVR